MSKALTAAEVADHFAEHFSRAVDRGESFVLLREGQPDLDLLYMMIS